MSTNAKFTQGNLMRHVAVMSFTASIGVMVFFAVDFVDMLFISMLGQKELAAAVGYAGAILFFNTSVAIGFSIAGGARVARLLGEGKEHESRCSATASVLIGLGLSALLTLALWLSLDFWVHLVGANGETAQLAKRYLQIVVPFWPLLVFGIMGIAIARAEGFAREAAMFSLIGGVVNAILDPILIFGLDLRLDGAALATVASRFVTAGYGVWLLRRKIGTLVAISLKGLRWEFRPMMAIGLPAILTNIATPVGQGYVTRAMAEFGDGAVSAIAVIGRVTPIAFAVVFALSGAVGPIVGQNAGAGNMDRVKRSFVDALIFTAIYTLVATAILFLYRSWIADMFEADAAMRSLIYLFCGPLALLYFFNGAIFVFNAGFNNLGKPIWSTAVNWGRNTAGTIPFVAAGAALWGAHGVLIGQAAGGVVFAVIGAVALARLLSKDVQKSAASEKGNFQNQVRLMQIFNRRR